MVTFSRRNNKNSKFWKKKIKIDTWFSIPSFYLYGTIFKKKGL